ncbi:MAG TPA: S-methyl-5-thioribose-1-phosphate isomerase [Deltaproteobacteria bacterium]|nr:S-methyl-5-thioribose-1-phosphate isomerase [Deltaproteobacteria bacterium]
MKVDGTPHRTVWLEGTTVRMINQPLLPHRFEIVALADHHATARAIQNMTVRGAGAIGATAGFAMAQAALLASEASFHKDIAQAAAELRATRPTAQNLFYAIRTVLDAVAAEGSDRIRARQAAVEVARQIADDDAACCEAIGTHGAERIGAGARINTHCNAGWLAFVDWGSALAPVFVAHRQGKAPFVWVDETRPRGQGARLTAWELSQEGIPHAVICDSATGHYLRTGQIDLVIVGSDRIAANGDVANKIGTYSSAVVARANGVPFYVAAPTTTIDVGAATGGAIPIEERSPDEVRYTWGLSDDGTFTRVRTTLAGGPARNPAFDVTPAELITGIITERGIIEASPAGIASVARR